MAIQSYKARSLVLPVFLAALLTGQPARAQTSPAPAPELPPVITSGFLRVTAASVPIPITDPGAPVTFNTGAKLPLFQQNDQFFVALVTDDQGSRLCAFPLKSAEKKGRRTSEDGGMFGDYPSSADKRSAWVTVDNEMFFAYRATSCTGALYLAQDEKLPVIGETGEAYHVIVERFGHHVDLWLPRSMPDIEFTKAETAEPSGGGAIVGPATAPAGGTTAAVVRKTLVLKYPPEKFEEVTEGQGPPPVEEKKTFWQKARARVATAFASKPKSVPPETVVAAAQAPAEPAAGETAKAAVPAPAKPGPPKAEPKPRKPILPRVFALLERAQPVVKILLGFLILVSAYYSIKRQVVIEKEKAAKRRHAKLLKVSKRESEKAAVTGDFVLPKADFTGSISSMSLGSLTQFLNADKETGTLNVKDKSGSDHGTMFFLKGEIFDAHTQNKRGVDAVYEVLKLQQGTFSFLREEHERMERTVDQGTISILLDAHRIMDEETSPELKT